MILLGLAVAAIVLLKVPSEQVTYLVLALAPVLILLVVWAIIRDVRGPKDDGHPHTPSRPDPVDDDATKDDVPTEDVVSPDESTPSAGA